MNHINFVGEIKLKKIKEELKSIQKYSEKISEETLDKSILSKNSLITRINQILDRIANNEDFKNPITEQEFMQSINQNGYNIIEANKRLEKYLQTKIKNYIGKEEGFQQDCLYEYASYVIPMIKQDYSFVLKPEAIERLDHLIINKKIEIQDGSKGEAHTDGRIAIPKVKLTSATFIKDIRYNLNVLLHEIFHQTHRYKVGDNLNVKVDGKEYVARDYGGYLFEEGLTDKATIDFARRHGLSCSPMYEYHIYTQLIDLIEKGLNCSTGDLFDQDYRMILNKINPTGQLLENYRFAELSRYASTTFSKYNYNQVEFDFNKKTYEVQKFRELSKEIKTKYAISKKSDSEENEILKTKIEIDQKKTR